ncbi:uncharacterized protein FPRO_08769 [Fusarium proliferatum ET1]|uniref:Uncharacterized protein n=1 Tax=Fusarium proliferatum (strain ET1) TaxID=1227346 RepID=A0A1L7W448_FUSPR|nr:uncharacterized protein FPRO_08769 [Fusarium proliferatum ET1]CZR47395.1 uncharacterized protein FPRO_08769 [Fusarium proliferatum ET1]
MPGSEITTSTPVEIWIADTTQNLITPKAFAACAITKKVTWPPVWIDPPPTNNPNAKGLL